METHEPSRRVAGLKSRWFSLSLRVALVLILAVAAWLAWVTNRARAQRRALAQVKALGGLVYYDYQYPNPDVRNAKWGATSPGPAWLRRWIGEEYFREVVEVDFISEQKPVSDSELAIVRSFPRLRHLNVISREITVAGLEVLDDLPELRTLWLKSSRISDAGLVHLRRLPKLRELVIYFQRGELPKAPLSDTTLSYLEGLVHLRHLCISNAGGITDAGLAHLKGLHELRWLELAHSQIKGPGLANLKRIEKRFLYGSRVDDEGLAGLSRCTYLFGLDLSESLVKGPGLSHLRNLKGLDNLVLTNTPLRDLEPVRHFEKLTILWIQGTQVVDLRPLAHLTQLRSLWIDRTQVKDLRPLQGLNQLDDLNASRTLVTDIEPLKCLKKLSFLSLRSTKVAPEKVADLQRALTELRISVP